MRSAAIMPRIDPATLGYPITVFAMVSLRSQAEQDLAAFEQHVATIPEVRECHMLNGEIDFILKIVASDLKGFQEILMTQLTPAPNVRQRQDVAHHPHCQVLARDPDPQHLSPQRLIPTHSRPKRKRAAREDRPFAGIKLS